MAAKPRVAIVDQGDRFVRWASREEVHAEHAPHRSVQVLVVDSQERLILQRRHASKLTYPDTWDMSCSGHVEEPDYPDPSHPDRDLPLIYDAVAARELAEELGIHAELLYLGTFAPEPAVHYEHFRLYLAKSDGPFVPQADEVAEVRALSPRELDALLADPSARITPSLRFLIAWARTRGWLATE